MQLKHCCKTYGACLGCIGCPDNGKRLSKQCFRQNELLLYYSKPLLFYWLLFIARLSFCSNVCNWRSFSACTFEVLQMDTFHENNFLFMKNGKLDIWKISLVINGHDNGWTCISNEIIEIVVVIRDAGWGWTWQVDNWAKRWMNIRCLKMFRNDLDR